MLNFYRNRNFITSWLQNNDIKKTKLTKSEFYGGNSAFYDYKKSNKRPVP